MASSAVQNAAKWMAHSRRTFNALSQSLALGQVTTVDVPRTYPISRLRCRLSGNVTNASTVTYKSGGIWNIIQRISLRMDGATVLFDIPGKLLQHVTQVYNKVRPVVNQPATGTGAQTFDVYFEIPVNGWFQDSKYFSLLDATDEAGHNSLQLSVLWGVSTDVAATNCTVSNATLAVDVVSVAGGAAGEYGGIGFGYPIHLIEQQTRVLPGAQTDYSISLNRRTPYQRFILLFDSSGTPSDSILTDASLRMGSTVFQPKVSAGMLRSEMGDRYNIQPGNVSDWTGVYVFDVNDDERPNQMEMVADSTPFELLLTVASGGNLTVLSDRFALPIF